MPELELREEGRGGKARGPRKQLQGDPGQLWTSGLQPALSLHWALKER